jgi:hypothetical protein
LSRKFLKNLKKKIKNEELVVPYMKPTNQNIYLKPNLPLKKIRLKVWKNKNLKKKKKKNTNIKPDIKFTSSDPFKRHSTEEYKANLVLVDKG